MNNNYSRGSAGGIILIVVGIILCCLLLGVLVKTYKNSSFSDSFVPTQAVAPRSSTTSSGSSQQVSSTPKNEFVAPTGACEMIINEPDDEDNVSYQMYFSGYLRGCGSVSAQMLLGSVSVYRYGTAELLAPTLTLKAQKSVINGDVPFSGYVEIPNELRVEKGVVKFKHFLPSGGTNTISHVIYF